MILRKAAAIIKSSLNKFPVVGLIGSRQTGKTTLAKSLAGNYKGRTLYLDLEKPSDFSKLDEPELYLEQFRDRLVILDEIQRKPELFPLLRSLVDEDRRNGRFLILGSASPELRRQASESLAGRIIYHELAPLTIDELGYDADAARSLWLRGGYPLSFLAPTDEESAGWREAFIRTHLERDIPQLGIRVPAAMLRRFWQMLSHLHGQIWNSSRVAASLGISPPTARHYLDILQDTFMIRQLQPYFVNIKKRLIKAPKIYIRDSGILHALLRIHTADALLGHPAVGASWEGWVAEQVISRIPSAWDYYYYRTGGGAEIDLVLVPPGQAPIAVEIKHTAVPAASRGFREGFADLRCARGYIIYQGREKYPLDKNIYALPVFELERLLRKS